jgi:phosphoribosylaminoimidazole (AIR) synthetase
MGLCVTVAESEADKAVETLRGTGLAAWRIGHAVADPERRVRVRSERIVGLSKHFTAEP